MYSMDRKELLQLESEKLKELADIQEQLDELYQKEIRETEDYIGKYYRLNNSNCYIHVTNYNHNKKELMGYEICFSIDSLDLYETEYNINEIERYDEVSKEELKKDIREHMEQLVKRFTLEE